MRFLSLALLLLAPAALAQTPGECQPGRAQADLDVSDVRATLFNTGSLFFGNGLDAAYVVPKAGGVSPVYSAFLWMGGTVGGQLRVATTWYGISEFWPGPLDAGAALPDPEDCSVYDRIWVVSVLDVQQYEAGGAAVPDLAEWPVGLGAPAVDASGAPITSSDRDRVLDLAAGERPAVAGSQTAFWIMNDVGNEHPYFGTDPLGVEVAVTAFSTISDEAALNQATVYRYAITNRSANPVEGFVVGFETDPNLGNGGDDWMAADTTRGLTFVYNAGKDDSQYGTPPAFGLDLLSGDFAATRSTKGSGPTDGPLNAAQAYNALLGLWNDGVPITEFGGGYMSGGPVTTYQYPGDPVTGAFWSAGNSDGQGTPIGSGSEQIQILSATPSTLAPGATRTVDLALVFGQGADRLDSITELRAASDRIQAAYDDGSLFETGPSPELLATPALATPADGASFEGDAPITLSWNAVPGAEGYLVQVSTRPDFPNGTRTQTTPVQGTALQIPAPGGEEVQVRYWRVRAEAAGAISFYADARSFSVLNVAADFRGEGRGIVEVARPAGSGAVCPASSADDWGCQRGLGNTVFNDPDGAGDYAVGTDTDAGVVRLRRFVASLAPAAAEMRFTDAGGYGIEFGRSNDGPVWRVPFELWNLGEDADDPSDDVRMIPFIIREDGTDYAWVDAFPRTDPASGQPATARVYGMMPDRADGYALFAAAAEASGVGNAYVDTDVTDTPLDPGALLVGDVNPSTGEVCPNTGGYVSYCYRNTETSQVTGANAAGGTFVYPIGRTTLVDLAGDGTTPPAGTVIRFLTTSVGDFAVSDEGGPVAGTAARLLPVRPNPSRGAAAVPFELAAAGRTRVTVVDALGREVAVLADRELSAGAHEVALDGSRLAAGVYVVVLEAGGERLTRTLTVTR